MKKSFGQILKEIRRSKNISQRELAVNAGVDFTYISKLENDRLPPPAADTIAKLAAHLDTPEEVFFAASGKMNNEIRDVITSSPEAMKFLTEATQMRLTGADWNKLLGNLKKLK
ncbi:MAG TPA: helix-turn-helix transcriptional regulator [Chitinophagaceae bacterium]|nr:helix-turn-helix transcriptional regulator [Chitinophagaceae bacterium]